MAFLNVQQHGDWYEDFCYTILKNLLGIRILEKANAAYSKTGEVWTVTLKKARISRIP